MKNCKTDSIVKKSKDQVYGGKQLKRVDSEEQLDQVYGGKQLDQVYG